MSKTKKYETQNLAQQQKQAENKNAEAQISTEATKPSLKVYGQDITVTDGDLIDYYRTRMKMMVMRFMLVGRFDDKGIYRIKNEIKYDLIRMNKEISDSGEDFYRAEARFITKFFYFNIKIEVLEDKKAKASLYLSEYVDDFLEDEYIVSHIADYTDDYDEQFRVKIRRVFNLYDAAIKNDEFKMPSLAVLMQDEYDINEYIGGLYDIASQIYVMRMLKLLETSSEPECQEIIKRYKELIVDKDENDINEKYKFTKFKALLDRAIDEKGGLEKLKVNKDELKSIINEVNKSVKAIDGVQKRAAAVEVLKTGDSPTSSSKGGGSKKKTAGKSGSAKSSSSSSKGKDKKSGETTKKADKKETKKEEVKADLGKVLDAYEAGKKVIEEAKSVFGKIAGTKKVEQKEMNKSDKTLNSAPPTNEKQSNQIGNIELEEDELSDAVDAMSFNEDESEDLNTIDAELIEGEDKEGNKSIVETAPLASENDEQSKEDEKEIKVEVTVELEDPSLSQTISGEMEIVFDDEEKSI